MEIILLAKGKLFVHLNKLYKNYKNVNSVSYFKCKNYKGSIKSSAQDIFQIQAHLESCFFWSHYIESLRVLSTFKSRALNYAGSLC